MKICHIAVPVFLSMTLAACAVDDGFFDYGDDYGRSQRHERDYDRDRDDRRSDRWDNRDYDDDDDERDYRSERERRYGSARTFVCENGMKVRIRRLGDNKIRLNTDGKSAVMENAVSASGERYTANSGLFGNGGEWHQKGSEAMFSFTKRHGGEVETACSRD